MPTDLPSGLAFRPRDLLWVAAFLALLAAMLFPLILVSAGTGRQPSIWEQAALIAVAVLLGWSPPAAGWAPAVLGALLGTAAFGGLGLLLAGTLPGVGTLAVANGLYLVLLLTGGMVVPLSELPSGLATAARALPAAPLTEVITGSLGGGGVDTWAWVSLTAWAVVAPVAAALLFRWSAE